MGKAIISGGAKGFSPNRLYLYREGEEFESLTGGWVSQGLGLNATYNEPDAPILRKTEQGMVVLRSMIDPGYKCGIVLPQNKIDFTGYDTLNVRFDATLTLTNCIFMGHVRNELGAACEDGQRYFTIAETGGYVYENIVRSGNISSLSGLYVPYFTLYSGGCATIREVWLERG